MHWTKTQNANLIVEVIVNQFLKKYCISIPSPVEEKKYIIIIIRNKTMLNIKIPFSTQFQLERNLYLKNKQPGG